MPRQNEIRQPMPKLRSTKVVMSTIGSLALSTRQKKAIAETAQIAAKVETVVSCSHSCCGPSSSTYSSEQRKPALNKRHNQTKCSGGDKVGWSRSNWVSSNVVVL